MSSSRRAALVLAALALLGLAAWFPFRPSLAHAPESVPPPAPAAALVADEAARSDLELREGRLHLLASGELFTGALVERYSPTALRARIAVRDGLADGEALGWYDTGEPEVRETFVAGLSHGLRTRWFKNGNRRSEAEIRDGQLHGLFREWHENGQLAVEMTLAAGQPTGPVRRWAPSGQPLPDYVPPALAAR
jgi:hypothetical protein